jgi:hypothetical protein
MLSRRDALRLSYFSALSLLPIARALALQQAAPGPAVPVASEAAVGAGAVLPPKIHTGIRVPISSALVATDRATQIWADEAILSGEIATGGHDVLIVARLISFQPNAIINTQGPLSSPSYPQDDRAKDGSAAGDAGGKGGDGAHGARAGNVLLISPKISGLVRINVDGQTGGHAQSGGNGAPGRVATPQRQSCARGNAGGRGGDAGAAGTPGNGGDGGSITVIVSDGTAGQGRPVMTVRGGAPGNPGQHGKPGSGGPGGSGGSKSKVCD